MKNSVALLLKIQLMRVCNPALLKNNGDRKKKMKLAFVLLGGLILSACLMFYSGLMAYGYIYLGMEQILPRLMLGICSVFVFVFIFLWSNGALFGGSDFDQVVSLPVKIWQVVAAKVLTVYFMGLFVFLVFFLPAQAVYFVVAKPNVKTVLSVLILLFFGPVLPVILGLALGTVILALTSRLRHRQLFSMVLNMAALIACCYPAN